MIPYDQAFVIRARRAIDHGLADARAFVSLAKASGLSLDRTAELLQEDLENEGPIFGKFMRSLRGAAAASVETAARQGEVLGYLNRNREFNQDEIDYIIDGADPDDLAEAAGNADDEEVVYVAMLVNTCERCLPYHGTVMTRREWAERGIEPGPGGTMHEGWDSECKCRFMPVEDLDRPELMAPLKRVPKKDSEGRKISGRTVRDVSQIDVDKALAAVEKAKESEAGRRALRWMGKANEGADDE